MQTAALFQDDPVRRKEALKTLSLGLVTAVVTAYVIVLALWLVSRSYPIVPFTGLAGTIVFISLASYWLNGIGKSRFAAYLFVYGFLLMVPVITLLVGGVTGPLAILYLFPVIVSSIVIGISNGFLVATLAVICYLAMIPVESAGFVTPVIPPVSGTPVPLFLAIWAVFYYLIAFLSWFAASRLQRSLQETRLYAGELETANEKLQASEEELRVSNEELESANEELRATEEELRASNEELEAANEELRTAQEQMVRSEKLVAIGQLAGGVGHELRNPLGAIKNAVYYIRGKLAKSDVARQEPRVMEFLEIVDDEISASNKIINDLLSFSRVGKPATSPARVEKIVADALAHVTLPDNVLLVKKLPEQLPEIEVDTDQMRQVLVNILTNAVQAMPEGGGITIAAGMADGFLELKVSDTGGGVPGDVLPRIFDPLFTTRAKGIGLGLAVCRSIIERHNGQISATSQAGKGTTFTVRLPVKAAAGVAVPEEHHG
ncbi:MAG: ATP-binding protein [Chloroflexota bacterium]